MNRRLISLSLLVAAAGCGAVIDQPQTEGTDSLAAAGGSYCPACTYTPPPVPVTPSAVNLGNVSVLDGPKWGRLMLVAPIDGAVSARFANDYGQWLITQIQTPLATVDGNGAAWARKYDPIAVDYQLTADFWNTGPVNTTLAINVNSAQAVVPMSGVTEHYTVHGAQIEVRLADVVGKLWDTGNYLIGDDEPPISFHFTLANLSNTTGSVWFDRPSSPVIDLSCSGKTTLAPGETSDVWCTASTFSRTPQVGLPLTVRAHAPTYSPSSTINVNVMVRGSGGGGGGSGGGGGCSPGQPGCMCNAGACNAGAVCVSGSTCYACGGLSQPCCAPNNIHANPWCDGPGQCQPSQAQGGAYSCL